MLLRKALAMMENYRENAARFYDFWADPYDDNSFYRDQLPSPEADVLELGCGTGRVLLPMTESCRFIHGVDHSPGMLAICQRKLDEAGISPDQARIETGDITALDLGRKFDLITAPYRVMQNLESDAQVAGLLDTIRRHLASDGIAVLNTFRPRVDPETLKARLKKRDGTEYEYQDTKIGRMRMSEDCRRFRTDPFVMLPLLRYEHLDGNRVIDAAELPIAMRVWYPDELLNVITASGFRITARYGGNAGEPWGEGDELVVAFTHG
ncbi:MAG: methyltransferase domain-containing protein [Planctomycetota bacterium]